MKPCKECPFNKKANLTVNDLGGSKPTVYIGQVRIPFFLPCHMDKNYKGKESDFNVVNHCKGASIFRANIGIINIPDILLKGEIDTENVFCNEKEFLNHYGDNSEYTEVDYNLMSMKEYFDAQAKIINLKK